MAAENKNPWLVVLGSTVGLTVSVAPLLFQSFGVFLKPIASEFGAKRASASLALTVGNLGLIAGTLFVGRLIDRWGARRVIAASTTLLSFATASFAFSHTLPLFIVLFGVAALCGSGQTVVPYAELLSAWFDSRRGLALGIAMAGIGLGAALLPQVAQWVLGHLGWRGAYIILAGVAFVAAQSAVVLFIRTPRDLATSPERTPSQRGLPGMSAREAVRSADFWLLAVSIFLVVMTTVGATVHLIPLLTDHGASSARATAALSVGGVTQIVGRVVGGYCVDRFHAPKVAAVFFAAPILGVLVLVTNTANGVGPYVAAALIGLALGAEMDLMAFIVSRYFGLKAFGEIFGYLFAIFSLGASVGPVAMGMSFDLTGSYDRGIIGLGVSLAVAVFLVARLGAYRYPARSALAAGRTSPAAPTSVPGR
jgi:MFS family permease